MPGLIYKNEIEQLCDEKYGKNFCDFCCCTIEYKEDKKYESLNKYYQQEMTNLLSEYLIKKLGLFFNSSFTLTSSFVTDVNFESFFIVNLGNQKPIHFEFTLDIDDSDSIITAISIIVLTLIAMNTN